MMPDKKAVRSSVNSALLAEQIMNGLAGGEPKSPSTKQEFSPARSSSTSFSIKNIKVPDSLIESVVNFTKGTTEDVKEEQRVDEQEIETKISSLVTRLNSLLVEAKQVLSEMCGTGSGSFGVGKMGKLKKVKRGSNKTNK